MRRALLLMLVAFVGNVSAHNVVGTVYALGDEIEGEIGFSDGDLAPEGTVVIVSEASSGKQLASVELDDEGFFTYTPETSEALTFNADLGSGHVFEGSVGADELSSVSGEPKVDTEMPESSEQLALLIEKAVAKQLAPMRRDLEKYKAKASMQDIIGAIGYIFGICGIAFWWSARKKVGSKA